MADIISGPYLVTGASGQLGRLVLDHLLETGASPIIATTRTPEKLSAYAERGVDVRVADFNAPETLPAAFSGAKRILIISTDDFAPGQRLKTHLAAIAAATEAGVEHIVYTSLTNPGPESPISFAADHRGTEEALADCGLTHTILRNNLYTDMILMTGPQAIAMGQLFAAAGDGTAGYVSRDDCARAAAAALLKEATTATYDITGPELVGQAEVASLLSAVAGKEVVYVPISSEDLQAAMVQHGLPAPIAQVLATIDNAIADGTLSVASGAVGELTGRTPSSVADFIRANASALSGVS